MICVIEGDRIICEYTVEAAEERIFHTLSDFLLVFVKEGCGTFSLNGTQHPFEPGTTATLTCVDYLKKNRGGTSAKVVAVNISDKIFSARILEFFSITRLPFVTAFGADSAKIRTLLDMLGETAEGTAKNNDIFLRNLMKELLIFAVENGDELPQNPVKDIKTELAILYIYSHFRESISLEGTAAQVHYSANYFYHSFRENTGITFQKFLHNLRLDYAMNLLRFTHLSVSDICCECGYNSVQYFSTSFRKKFGKSPKYFIDSRT